MLWSITQEVEGVALELTPCGKFRATQLNMQMYSRGRKREHSKCFRTGDCRVGSTPTICAISVVESKDFTTDIFVYGFEM